VKSMVFGWLHGWMRSIRAGVSTRPGWGHIFASVVAGNQTPFSEFIRIHGYKMGFMPYARTQHTFG